MKIPKLIFLGAISGVLLAHGAPEHHPGPAKKSTSYVSAPVSKKEPVTTVKTEIIEVSRIEPPRAPTKSNPVCIEPYLLGVPSINSCRDVSLHGEVGGSLIELDEALAGCELVDDLSCDDGSGEGMKIYESRLSKQGGVPAPNRGVGACATVERRPNGSIHVATRFRGEILCCRALCRATTTTTTTTTTFSMSEALLGLEEPEPFIQTPPPPPIPTPQPEFIPTITTTPAPFQFAAALASTSEMCIMPQYLGMPRVATCQDLRDISLSTSYVYLTNQKAVDCTWVEDISCGPSYPGLGAFLDAGTPEGTCIAVKQDVCNTSIVGPYPILNRHLKLACPPKKESHGVQMMMVPMPGKKGGSRLLQEVTEEVGTDEVIELSSEPRALHGAAAPGKKGGNPAAPDTLIVCCRLKCSAGLNVSYTSSAAAAYAVAGTGHLRREPALPELLLTQGGGYSAPAPAPHGNGNNLCDTRFAQICSLATPLRGERIVFDQRCGGPMPLPGCYAGGISPCCRSVPKYEVD